MDNILEKLGITKGQWHWRVNQSSKSVALMGENGYLVMDFTRYGMQNAQPRFAIDGIMKKAENLAIEIEGQEHNRSWRKTLSTPDSRVISTAPEMLEALIQITKELDNDGRFNNTVFAIGEVIQKATGKSWEEVKRFLGEIN